MDLSVVIVTHNVAPLVADCLESLYRDCEGLEVEVFVVDSASSDETVEVVRERFAAARIVDSPVNVGFSRGNNLALGSCRGRYVALLNPDTVVTPGGISGLVSYLDRNPQVGAVGPRLRLADGSIQVECARRLPRLANLWQWLFLLDKLDWVVRHRKRFSQGRGDPPRASLLDGLNLLAWPRTRTCAVESICGACMVVRAEVVKEVGMLDEASPLYLDDIDYCRRILDAGRPIHYVAESSVTHLGGQSSGKLKRAGDLYAMQCHGIWLYLRKHEGGAAGAMFVAMVALASLVRLAICLVALALVWGGGRAFWLRQRAMVAGLARWALRWPRRAPRFGFASEAPR
jgi:hypothetical protein